MIDNDAAASRDLLKAIARGDAVAVVSIGSYGTLVRTAAPTAPIFHLAGAGLAERSQELHAQATAGDIGDFRLRKCRSCAEPNL
jgi:hypothetical protein